jgi:hypothetical protein
MIFFNHSEQQWAASPPVPFPILSGNICAPAARGGGVFHPLAEWYSSLRPTSWQHRSLSIENSIATCRCAATADIVVGGMTRRTSHSKLSQGCLRNCMEPSLRTQCHRSRTGLSHSQRVQTSATLGALGHPPLNISACTAA